MNINKTFIFLKNGTLKTILLLNSIILISCEKLDLNFNIKRDGFGDAKQNVRNKVDQIIDCSDISRFNCYAAGNLPSKGWKIGDGFSSSGLVTMNSTGGYIETSINFNENSNLSFWTKSPNLSELNFMPSVYVDGQLINCSIIQGSLYYTNWMKIQTSLILKGEHKLKIEFIKQTLYYDFYIDEINIIN